MEKHIKQSFDMLAQATGLLRLTREEHLKLQQALKTIEQELTSKPEAQSEPKE